MLTRAAATIRGTSQPPRDRATENCATSRRSFTCNQFYNITGASSAKATCGPVNGLGACNALISAGKNCVYHYAQYTCDQPSCSQGSFDACNSLCLTLDPDYVGPCTNSCHTWCGSA